MDIAVIIGISLFVLGTVASIWLSLDLLIDLLKDIKNELQKTNQHLENIRFSALNDANRTLFDIEQKLTHPIVKNPRNE
jgi:hypothetical protein